MTALNPELAAYLEPMAGFGLMLRHPLVYAVPYFGVPENERLNQLLEFRKQDLKKAIEKRDHHRFVFAHERPYRLAALRELHGEISTAELNPLILQVYVDSENARDNYDDWFELLEPLTGTDPWQTLHELPDGEGGEFTIYRGGPVMGFSWTLDLEKAKWFANRWDANGELWTATVVKDNVIGYYDGRGETEVVAVYDHIQHLITPFKE